MPSPPFELGANGAARPIIAGGGPAGAAAAIGLARAGAKPRLIERSRGPRDVVCGGFLGRDALAALDRLGIDPWALGAHPIRRVRIVTRRRTVEAELPALAAGLSRRTLDEALLAAAAQAGAGIERGVAIRRATAQALHLADGAILPADALFLATGKHELRGLARDHRRPHPALGMRASLAVSPALRAALDGVIELHPVDRGYAGVLLQDDGAANLCLSAAGDRLRAGGPDPLAPETWAAEAPLLADRLAAALPGSSAIAGVPYGWRARETSPGLFRLGDQAAVIPSIAGDGVAIALAGAASAVAAWVAHGPAGAQIHQRAFARAVSRPLAVAGVARGLAETAWLRGPAMVLLDWPPLVRALFRATRIDAAACDAAT